MEAKSPASQRAPGLAAAPVRGAEGKRLWRGAGTAWPGRYGALCARAGCWCGSEDDGKHTEKFLNAKRNY